MLVFAGKLLLGYFKYWMNHYGSSVTVLSRVLQLAFVLRINSAGYLHQHMCCLHNAPDLMSIHQTSSPFFVCFVLVPTPV